MPETALSLYAIDRDHEALEALLYEVGGDVTADDADAAIRQWTEENHANLDRKADGYAEIIRRFDALADQAGAEADRLADLARVRRNAADRLKDGLKLFMERRGINEISTPLHRFRLCANGGKAPLQIDPRYEQEPRTLPEQYRRTSYEPNRDAIRRDVEAGATVPFARLGPRGTHLRIK